MPLPIPVVLIGRLAVDERFNGFELGASLPQDALLKCVEAAVSVGIRAIIVDALNESAANLYRKSGFESMPMANDAAMYLLVKDAEETIGAVQPAERSR
ncbi:GNAT family N-acetyltransferase [Subtercola endophyticus]|uniref:GNAT family N-acetyltransferase n=1 Tax=Subtercola endophyticus TaxID=2895559 RepID=UPI001E59B957|nr:GNAT family N-acetyltransferase [Subtercola endophyticus]UFS59442.1 GNAT family N-acetyltransferase [Subtercola endophyticus]